MEVLFSLCPTLRGLEWFRGILLMSFTALVPAVFTDSLSSSRLSFTLGRSALPNVLSK